MREERRSRMAVVAVEDSGNSGSSWWVRPAVGWMTRRTVRPAVGWMVVGWVGRSVRGWEGEWKREWGLASFSFLFFFSSFFWYLSERLKALFKGCMGDQEVVCYCCLNKSFQCLNNITRIFTHFFTHTYF